MVFGHPKGFRVVSYSHEGAGCWGAVGLTSFILGLVRYMKVGLSVTDSGV